MVEAHSGTLSCSNLPMRSARLVTLFEQHNQASNSPNVSQLPLAKPREIGQSRRSKEQQSYYETSQIYIMAAAVGRLQPRCNFARTTIHKTTITSLSLSGRAG